MSDPKVIRDTHYWGPPNIRKTPYIGDPLPDKEYPSGDWDRSFPNRSLPDQFYTPTPIDPDIFKALEKARKDLEARKKQIEAMKAEAAAKELATAKKLADKAAAKKPKKRRKKRVKKIAPPPKHDDTIFEREV